MQKTLLEALCLMPGANIAWHLLQHLMKADLTGMDLTRCQLVPSDDHVLSIIEENAQTQSKLANALNSVLAQYFYIYLEHLVELENRELLRAKLSYNLVLNTSDAQKTTYEIIFFGKTYRKLTESELAVLCNDIVCFEKHYLKLGIYPQLAVTLFVAKELIDEICLLDSTFKEITYDTVSRETGYFFNLISNVKRPEILKRLSKFNPSWEERLSRKKPSFLVLIEQSYS